MKKIIPIVFLAIVFASCEKNQQQEPKLISTTITDLKGNLLQEVSSGVTLRLSAPEFKELNRSFSLVKDGVILFDKLEAKIIAAADDYIITAVPILDIPDPRRVTLQLAVSVNTVATLCLQCIYYRPTVTGTIFAGFSGGVTDGTFSNPAELIHDFLGNLYVIDQRASGHDVIMKVNPSGVSSVFSGGAGEFGRLVGIGINNSTGLLYVADATAQQVRSIAISSPSLINVVAGNGSTGNVDGTGTTASFRFSSERVDSELETGQGLTVDAMGNIYVGERYNDDAAPVMYVSQLRKITTPGMVSTVAGSRIFPSSMETITYSSGVAINGANEMYTTTGSSSHFQGINQFTAAGVFTRFAGQVSTEALSDGLREHTTFTSPKAISHFNGFYYVADGLNGALRRVSPAGRVITLAGVGRSSTSSGYGSYLPPIEGSYLMESGLVIPAFDYYLRAARGIRMDYVGGVTAVHGGLIYVADYGYNCIWKITIR